MALKRHYKSDGLCANCRKRPAKFRYKGKIRRDKQHDLCLQCFRSIDDSNMARLRTTEYGADL